MAGKICKLLIALCALVSLVAIVCAAPVLEQRQPALLHGDIAHVLPPVGQYRPRRRSLAHRREKPLAASGARWTVREGDTGNRIAAQLGIKFFQLAFLNPTVRWRFLQIGQFLNIPGDGSSSHIYIVVAGDTGNAISAANGISFSQLDAFNRNIDWYNLQIGQSLVVPSPYIPSPYTNTTRVSQLPDIEQVSQDADVPASSLDLPVATVVDDSVAEVATTTKEISPFLIPGETNSPSNEFGSRSIRGRQVRNMRPAAPQTPAGATVSTTRKVRAGETKDSIAARMSISSDVLDKANPGMDWNSLRPGQVINIPAGISTSGAANVPTVNQFNKQKPGAYVQYKGNATTAQPPYPSMSSWLPFDQLWDMNSGNIGKTCSFALGDPPPNTESETAALRSAIVSVASETNVNSSFILAMILQESNGCVRVPTTSSWQGITNPGLMQSFKGRASCNSGSRMLQDCPAYMIRAMIVEGVRGNKEVGILPALRDRAKQAGSPSWPLKDKADAGVSINGNTQVQPDEAMLYYQAARIYNSGHLPADGDLSAPTGSTRCYVSDVVNRLMGWTGMGSCSLN